MNSTNTPPAVSSENAPLTPDDHVQRTIVDPNDLGFYFAQVMQWIALHPEIPHTAFRVYCVMRALYTHRRDLRSISKDQLRYLVPGVNGKPMSMTVLNDALKVLSQFDLVTNPDGKKQTWRLRDPETNQFVQHSELTFQLGQLPPGGDAFEGHRNVFDKLEAYPGQGWDKPAKTATTATPKTVAKAPAVVSEEPQVEPSTGIPVEGAAEKTAVQPLDRNSESRDRNSGWLDRNSGRCTPVTRRNQAPNKGFQQQDQQPTNQPTPVAEPTTTARRDDGRMVGSADPSPETAGARMLRSLPLPTPLPKPVVNSYASTVDELLTSGWTEPQLAHEFTRALPKRPSNLVGLVIRRIEATSPKPATTTASRPDAGDDRVRARIDALVRQGEAGARMADQMLGTREWAEPDRGDLPAHEYLVHVLPEAARTFVEERRDRLVDVMTHHPAWRL